MFYNPAQVLELQKCRMQLVFSLAYGFSLQQQTNHALPPLVHHFYATNLTEYDFNLTQQVLEFF